MSEILKRHWSNQATVKQPVWLHHPNITLIWVTLSHPTSMWESPSHYNGSFLPFNDSSGSSSQKRQPSICWRRSWCHVHIMSALLGNTKKDTFWRLGDGSREEQGGTGSSRDIWGEAEVSLTRVCCTWIGPNCVRLYSGDSSAETLLKISLKIVQTDQRIHGAIIILSSECRLRVKSFVLMNRFWRCVRCLCFVGFYLN